STRLSRVARRGRTFDGGPRGLYCASGHATHGRHVPAPDGQDRWRSLSGRPLQRPGRYLGRRLRWWLWPKLPWRYPRGWRRLRRWRRFGTVVAVSAPTLTRICEHLLMTPRRVRQKFPQETLAVIERAIADSESTHGAEICFVVEGALQGAA